MATSINFPTYGFINDTLALNEENWRKFFKPFIYDSVQSGLVTTKGTGMTVDISAGECRCGAVMGLLNSSITLDVSNGHSTYDRIDSVMVQYSYSDPSTLSIAIKQGTPSANPVAPEMSKVFSSLWQMEIAQILVPSGSTSSSSLTITDKRVIYESIESAINDIVISSSTEPTSPMNEIWFQDEPDNEYTVPTNAEFTELEQDVTDLKNSLESVWSGETVFNPSGLNWSNGGINSGGGNYNTKAYCCRTNDYYEFPYDSVTIYDSNAPYAYNLTAFAYNKETSAFVTAWYVKPQTTPTKAVDTQYKYRFEYSDADKNGIPNYTSLRFSFEVRPSYLEGEIEAKISDNLASMMEKEVFPDWQICSISGSTGNVGTNSNSRVISTNNMLTLHDAVITVTTTHENSLSVYYYDNNGTYFKVVTHSATGNQTINLSAGKYRLGYIYTDTTDAIDNMINRQHEITIIDRLNYAESTPIIESVDAIEIENPGFVRRRPLICFTDDDGHTNVMSKIVPIMQTYSVPFSLAICSTLPNTWQFTHLTYSQMHTLVDEYGCEMFGHGQHPLIGTASDLPVEMTTEEVEAELKNTKLYLEQHGFTVRGYGYPYGRSNEMVRELTAKYYEWGAKGNDPQQNIRVNENCVPSFYINRVTFPCGDLKDAETEEYPDTTSLEYLKAIVDECVQKNGWLVFVTHAFYITTEQISLLEQLIQYIQTLGVETVTMSEAWDVFKNDVEAGDYLGYWNNDTSIHLKKGFAVNKIGQTDGGEAVTW